MSFPIIFKKIYPFIFAIVLSSCVSTIEKRGYNFDLSDHDMLQEGVTTKSRVLKTMGSPTLISDFNYGETWIYYSEDVEHFLFFQPKIISRNVVALRFDRNDTVSELKKIDLTNEEKKLHFESDFTLVEGHKTGFFKAIFSNVGQVKPQ